MSTELQSTSTEEDKGSGLHENQKWIW